MARQVNIRDRTCRAPGCEIPTERTDLDHTNEWTTGQGGSTTETNLAALHRGHHNLKTAGFWDSEQSGDGTLVWTTATGRTVATYPFMYEHPDNLPLQTSPLEVLLGRCLAQVINPEIPLPGHFNIFDAFDWSQTLAPANPTPPPHQWPTWLIKEQSSNNLAPHDEAPPPF